MGDYIYYNAAKCRHYSLLRIGLFLSLLAVAFSASASTGSSWLVAQAQPDGSYSSSSDISTSFQSTAEALRTLLAIGQSSQPGMTAAFQYIDAANYSNTESLARKIIAATENNQDVTTLTTQLFANQNSDGGFGEFPGYNSTSLDTALALNALAIAKISNDTAIQQAIVFLTQQQSADGGYELDSGTGSALYTTALVSLALQKYMFRYTVSQNIDSATNYLYKAQISTGGWANDWETAIALLAVVPVTTDTSQYSTAVNILRSNQLSDGSWGDSVYTTALALRALHLVDSGQTATNPDYGTVIGRIVDSVTGQPLAGVSISLSQNTSLQTKSLSDGTFSINNIPPGQYNIQYDAAGYSSASQSISIQQSQISSTGTINLSPLPTTGILSGTVTDAATNAPIAGATINIVGAANATTTTDAQGNYRIALAPGSVTISTNATGYDAVSATGTITAGGALIFSPKLYTTGTTPSGTSLTITGNVIDAASQTPISGAVVTQTGTTNSATTDTNGNFSLPGLSIGSISLTVTKSGYSATNISFVAPTAGTATIGTVQLTPQTALTTSSISGIIQDASTGQPIGGAQVSIQGTSLVSTTDSNGEYQISGITTLNFTIVASATGYVSRSSNVSMTQPQNVQTNITLQPAAVNGFAITQASTDKAIYGAYDKVTLNAEFTNNGSASQSVQLLMNVIDSNGTTIQSYPAVHGPIPNIVTDSTLAIASGKTIDTTFEWMTGPTAPGTYKLVLQAYDMNTLRLLSQRSATLSIGQSIVIPSVTVSPTPQYTNVGATEHMSFTAEIDNKSNVPYQITVGYKWQAPDGATLSEKTVTTSLSPDEVTKSITLDTMDYTFVNSGEYHVVVEIPSGPAVESAIGRSVYVAPSVRVDPTQSITPSTIIPGTDKRIHINIQLQGQDQG